jgi:hypothetical protein
MHSHKYIQHEADQAKQNKGRRKMAVGALRWPDTKVIKTCSDIKPATNDVAGTP